jgi:hypothetical protein
MRLITLEFEIAGEAQDQLLESIDGFQEYWTDHDVRFQLFQDTARKTRFVGTFFTEKSVDQIVALIQKDAQAKALFDRLKQAGAHLVLSVLEEVSG